jgi:hypothetical protein
MGLVLSKHYVLLKINIFVVDIDLLMKNISLLFSLIFLFLSASLVAQDIPVAAENYQDPLTFTITPNPMTNGVLYFKTLEEGPIEVLIFNILGEKIYFTTTQERSLNLQQLLKGIYFVQLKQGRKTGIKRLVVP